MDTNYKDYIFIIYSHKLNIKNANKLYERYLSSFIKNLKIKVFITYGDKSQFIFSKNDKKSSYYTIKDNCIILNTDDDYSNLNKKTAILFKSLYDLYPNMHGCFKCDDDLILNINSLFKMKIYIEYCESLNMPVNYCGKLIYNIDDEIDLYCGGPFYYCSNAAVKCFRTVSSNAVSLFIAEDRMVGSVLRQNKISPIHYDSYFDDILEINGYNFHNKDHKNTVFVRIQGGLGNQLFQIISGYGIALKNNMNFVILDSSEVKTDFTHTTNNAYIIKRFFGKFPNINMQFINTDLLDYYKEKPEHCLQYDEIKFNDDVLLDGFFQNEKYFSFCRNEILYKLKSTPEYYRFFELMFGNKAEIIREKATNGYFIHIRRGDYVKNQLYSINYDKYFSSAIAYILSIDPSAFFFIVSDDIPYCKSYNILNNIQKEFIELEDIETMYFMTYCNKGGICSNSTFSWWGSYLIENPDKIVTFPSKWMNNDWVNDIYYDGSITINC